MQKKKREVRSSGSTHYYYIAGGTPKLVNVTARRSAGRCALPKMPFLFFTEASA